MYENYYGVNPAEEKQKKRIIIVEATRIDNDERAETQASKIERPFRQTSATVHEIAR